MRSVRTLTVCGAAMLCLVLPACGGSDDEPAEESAASGAQTKQVGELDVGVATAQPDHVVLYVAQEKGYFEDEGVDVEIKVTGSANAATSIVSGHVDFMTVSSLGTQLSTVNSGKDVQVFFANLGEGATSFTWAKPDGVSDPSDCTNIATFPTGTSPYAWANLSKTLFGSNAKVSTLADTATLVSAFSGDRFDCAVATYGTFSQSLQQDRVRIIFDPREEAQLPEDFPEGIVEAGMYGLTENLAEKRPAITAFLRAYLRAVEDVKTQPVAESVALLKQNRDFETLSAEDIADAIENTLFSQAPDDGDITPEGWRATMDFFQRAGLAFIEPDDPQWSFDQRVDMSYRADALK